MGEKNMIRLPVRQVHLDFHTSEHIPGVGSAFDKEQFQGSLKDGRVGSITLFAKGHHGWSYYPTKIGAAHPSLKIDLMGQQIAACHEISVRAPIYYTVGWSANDAENHPEWCVRKKDGVILASDWDEKAQPGEPRPPASWKFLCPSGEYLDLILRQTEEICTLYAVDGLFYDITNGPVCYCGNCRSGMDSERVDIDDLDAVIAFNVRKWKHMMSECNHVIRKHHGEATVFYNGSTVLHADRAMRDCVSRMYDYNTHQELEDLPTTWGGYDKLPLRAKFFQNTGKQLLAMSGKFHTSWGEFGGFKHPDAILYEAASMIAFGAACSFGDQLHPEGAMDRETYRSIGSAYDYVEKIEEYGPGGRHVSNLGVWLTGDQANDEGTVNMLLETQTDFVVIDPDEDISECDTVILTGAVCLQQHQAEKLNAFVGRGGSLLVLGKSALDRKMQDFIVDLGADYAGPARYREDFLVAGEKIGSGIVSSPFVTIQLF